MRTTFSLSILLGLVALSSPAAAQRVELTPAQTATITDANGTDGSVMLVRFSLPSGLAGARVVRAIVLQGVNCQESGGTTGIAESAPSGWDATTVTWSWWTQNRNQTAASRKPAVALEDCRNGTAIFDASAWVRKAVETGSSTVDLAFLTSSPEDTSFEYQTTERVPQPKLQVMYRPRRLATTTGITGGGE